MPRQHSGGQGQGQGQGLAPGGTMRGSTDNHHAQTVLPGSELRLGQRCANLISYTPHQPKLHIQALQHKFNTSDEKNKCRNKSYTFASVGIVLHIKYWILLFKTSYHQTQHHSKRIMFGLQKFFSNSMSQLPTAWLGCGMI